MHAFSLRKHGDKVLIIGGKCLSDSKSGNAHMVYWGLTHGISSGMTGIATDNDLLQAVSPFVFRAGIFALLALTA